MTKINKAARIKNIVLLQMSVIMLTWAGICGKLATQGNAFLSPKFLLFVFLDFTILVIYALIWQQILKRFDLHVAYANRAVSICWTLLWSVLIFNEKITLFNIIGTAVIVCGISLVTVDA